VDHPGAYAAGLAEGVHRFQARANPERAASEGFFSTSENALARRRDRGSGNNGRAWLGLAKWRLLPKGDGRCSNAQADDRRFFVTTRTVDEVALPLITAQDHHDNSRPVVGGRHHGGRRQLKLRLQRPADHRSDGRAVLARRRQAAFLPTAITPLSGNVAPATNGRRGSKFSPAVIAWPEIAATCCAAPNREHDARKKSTNFE
jgi:hypothetical protein